MDPSETNPGPIDASLLYDQENHVSSAVWDGQERGVLRCHEHTSKLGEWRLTQRQIELVEKAGFGYLRLLPSINLDNPLISALVERWRKETNTFHMKIGEMTITLKDVALLLGLPIDGEPVLGVTYTSCKSVCERFLGKVPDAGYKSGGMVKLSWLKEYFSQCPEDAPWEEIECHTRAYLLYLVGSTIFSTTTGNKVPVMYLPLFEDFEKAGKYAWGAAALAFLYRSLGRASLKSQCTISGCLTLLQCWSYFHLNIGRPKFYQEPDHYCFPFVLRWKGKQSAVTMKRDIVFYRKALDYLKPCDVNWLPYENMDCTLIPETIRTGLILGRSRTMLICFDKAERHLPDRCLRQHGLLQGIPKDVQQWERKSRGVDSGIDLSRKMELELDEWAARQLHIVQGDDGVDEREYMQWYLRITRNFVGRPMSPLSEFPRTVKFRTKKKRMNAGLRDIANIADTFSTRGLDPLQFESISKIRAIAHDCLGDEFGGAYVVSTTSQIELGKRKREKERVRRNINGTFSQKDDAEQCLTSRGGDQAQFLGTAVEADEMQLHYAETEVYQSQVVVDQPQTKLGHRMRKKGRATKTSKKLKQHDNFVQGDAAGEGVQSQACSKAVNADHKDGQSQVSQPTGEGERMQPQCAEGEVDHSQSCHAPGEGEKAESDADNEGEKVDSHTAGKGEKAESYAAGEGVIADSHAPGEGESTESHAARDSEKAESFAAGEGEKANAANKAEKIKLTVVTHVVGDLNLVDTDSGSAPQTAKEAVEVVSGSSVEGVEDIDGSAAVLTKGKTKRKSSRKRS